LASKGLHRRITDSLESGESNRGLDYEEIN
jgi:hypothetical protein